MIQNKEAMETKFNFNSEICTSRSQSERLLSLGLKKETADMVWVEARYGDDEYLLRPLRPNCFTDIPQIPAWSLHRLMILAATPLELDEMLGYNVYDYYDNAINHIESLIKEGYFNKEYLCES